MRTQSHKTSGKQHTDQEKREWSNFKSHYAHSLWMLKSHTGKLMTLLYFFRTPFHKHTLVLTCSGHVLWNVCSIHSIRREISGRSTGENVALRLLHLMLLRQWVKERTVKEFLLFLLSVKLYNAFCSLSLLIQYVELHAWHTKRVYSSECGFDWH